MMLIGYANFKSKDKTKEYFKILLLRDCTEKEREFGNIGMKPVEKFVSAGAFNSLNEKMIGKEIHLTWGGDEFSPQIVNVSLA